MPQFRVRLGLGLGEDYMLGTCLRAKGRLESFEPVRKIERKLGRGDSLTNMNMVSVSLEVYVAASGHGKG